MRRLGIAGFLLLTTLLGCMEKSAEEAQPVAASSLPTDAASVELDAQATKATKEAVEVDLTASVYVADQLCQTCHQEQFEAFAHTDMARSFMSASTASPIEDFTAEPFFHQASQRYYNLQMRGTERWFRRYQKDSQGQVINLFEQKVDWVIGSGESSRVYAYQTQAGEIFQLPLAWYSQSGSWAMAPGYDQQNHQGVLKQLGRECLTCHMTYPEVGEAGDAYDAPQQFPHDMPSGIGCQRCHGPASQHVSAAQEGNRAALLAAIVNPANLPARERDDVCTQCHMQPDSAMDAVRHFGIGDFHFQPGQLLRDSRLLIETKSDDHPKSKRFQLNHQAYRLRHSTCFLTSGAEVMSCNNCHDPHRAVPVAERMAHYREACLGCHQSQAFESTHKSLLVAWRATNEGHLFADVNDENCTECHMPQRRTQDYVQVVVADHYIPRFPPPMDITAAIKEQSWPIDDIEFIEPERLSDLGLQLYRTVALSRKAKGQFAAATDHLAKLLAKAKSGHPEAVFELVGGLIKQGRIVDAKPWLHSLQQSMSKHPQVLLWLAQVQLREGAVGDAQESLQNALNVRPDWPQAVFLQGQIQLQLQEQEAALASFERVISRQPNFVTGWFQRGVVLAQMQQFEAARRSFEQALVIQPNMTVAHLAVAQVLEKAGESLAAEQYLRSVMTVAAQPQLIEQQLQSVPQ